MKRIATLMAALALLACSKPEPATPDSGGGNNEPEPGITELGHPRILINDAQMQALRQKVSDGDEIASILHAEIMRVADKSVTPTSVLKYQLDASGRRILGSSRKALKRITSSAYAWRFTGEKKYLDRALEDFKTVLNFKNWNAENHFLDAGEMSLAVAIGYDWLYDKLSSYIKELAATKINDFAFSPTLGSKGFYSRMNNWNQVCNGGVIIAALAFLPPDDEMVNTLITKGIPSNKKAMINLYSPDGNYPEGPSYWNYGTSYEGLLLTVLEDFFGTDYGLSSIDGFMNTANYMVQCIGNSGQYWSYSDFAEVEANSSGLWYFAWKNKDNSLLYNELKDIRNGNYRERESERFLPLLAAYAARMESSPVKAPDKTYFCGKGTTPVAIARTGWSAADSYLAIKGGTSSSSHSHMDAGSFVYDTKGYRWALDIPREGYARWEVKMKEIGGDLWDLSQGSYRWDIFRYSPSGHSTIIADGQKQKVSAKATIMESIDAGGRHGAKLNMTPVLQAQLALAERTAALLDDGSLEITDRIKAKADNACTIHFQIVTPAKAQAGTDGILLTQGKETLRMSTTSSGPKPEYGIWTTNPAEMKYRFSDFEEAAEGTVRCGFEAVIPAGAEATFTTRVQPL